MIFFGLSTWALAVVLVGIMLGATAVGLVVSRAMGARSGDLREPFGVLQGALATGASSRACPARAHSRRCCCPLSATARSCSALPGTVPEMAMLVSA